VVHLHFVLAVILSNSIVLVRGLISNLILVWLKDNVGHVIITTVFEVWRVLDCLVTRLVLFWYSG